MPRYFFNIHYDDVQLKSDGIGEELPDHDAALKVAAIVVGKFSRNIDGKFQPEWNLEVTDEQHRPLFSILIMRK